MKILVTGCCGFIGSHVCEYLLQHRKDIHIVGIDNINDYYSQNQKYKNLDILQQYPNFTFKQIDILDKNIITIIKPTIIIHLAAMAGVRYSLENPTLYMKTNVEGQTNLLKQSVDNNVKLFIYASSSSVYGTNEKVPFSESDPINGCASPYAASKINKEIIAALYNRLYGLKTIGLRFFTVYGPRGRPDMAPYKFLSKIMNKQSFDKYGKGDSYRDYTYIDDIVSGVIGCMDYHHNTDDNPCEIYNLGNSEPITLNTFIETCEKVCGKSAVYNQLPEQMGDVNKTYADISKARERFGYDPKTKLVEGLTKTYEWLKD